MKAKTLKRSRSSDDEDRSRSKKPAKSSKRRRRDSGDDDRGRRRRRRISGGRHKNPGDNRRKESKRAAPRRSRYPSSSVSSHSSRSCSTCHRRSVSSSPERYRWAKVRARSRSRGREKEKKRGRGRSRKASKRSPSCSTCSRSPSRSCSGERRFKEESDRSRRIRLKSGANDAKDEERDKIIQAYDDFPSTRSNEGFDEAKNEKEAVSKKIETEPTENVDDPSIALASEKSEIAVSFDNLEAEELELVLRQKALENFKKFRGGVSAKRSSGDYKDVGVVVVDAKDAKGNIQGGSGPTRPRVRSVVSIPTGKEGGDGGDSVISPRDIVENSEPIDQTNEVPDTLNQLKRLEEDNNQMPSEETTVTKDVLHNKTAAAEHESSVGKTLEGPASGTSASVVTKVGNEAVVEDTTGSQFEQKTFSRMHDVPDTLNQLKRLEGDNDQMPSEQTTVTKDVLHNETAAAEHGSSIGKTLEGPASGTSVSVVTKVGNEAAAEETTGSQFEQKTFSRMHDGEMVQVSYKVYIPKKTPALARRQLQR